MKRIALLIGLLLPAWTAPAQPAPAPGSPKIAVLNLPVVFDGFRMTKDLEGHFEQRRQNIGAEAERRRQVMDGQRAALEAFDPASQDYTDRRDQLLHDQVEYQVWLEFEEQRLKNEHMGWLLKIYRQVRETVAQHAGKQGIDLVLTHDDLSDDIPDSLTLRREILLKKVLYFSDRIDLTDVVLEELNRRYAADGGAASLDNAGPPPPAPVERTQPAEPPRK